MRSPRETVSGDEAPQVRCGRTGWEVFQGRERREGPGLSHAQEETSPGGTDEAMPCGERQGVCSADLPVV